MPQTDFYLCQKDLLEVASGLFGQGAAITPDLRYPTESVLKLTAKDELEQISRDRAPRFFFVTSPEWERSPLVVNSVLKNGKKVHFVAQKEGGPTIDIFCPQSALVNGVLAIPPGFIAYHTRFWNPISRQMEFPPTELRSEYRAICLRLARGGKKIVRRHRQIIVTKNTQESGLRLLDLKKKLNEESQIISLENDGDREGKRAKKGGGGAEGVSNCLRSQG